MRAAKAARAEPSAAEIAMLEYGFDLDTGGTAGGVSRPLSNVARRAEAMSRKISDYDPRSDPHLVRFWRARSKQRRPASAAAPSTTAGQRTTTPPRTSATASSGEAARGPVNGPVSADHVLGLKRVFARFASELSCCGCTSDGGCTAACAGVTRERLMVLPSAGNNVHHIIRFGVNVSNHHRRLNKHPPLSIAFTEDRVNQWLDVLGCRASIDWPSFLLLCSADLQEDLATLRQLKQARAVFLQKRAVQSEADYHDLLAFMLYSHTTHDAKCASFFQSGDFYKARHACNFADTVFSLMPHRVQAHLHRANARGVTLSQNNCGHAPIAQTLDLSPTRRPRSAAEKRKLLRPPSSSNAKAVAAQAQAAAARRQARAFV